MILINSPQVAHDLLQKVSTQFSRIQVFITPFDELIINLRVGSSIYIVETTT